METLIRSLTIGLIALMLAMPASARADQGNLDLIITPNNARPLIQTSGATIGITLREKATLVLVNDEKTYPLSPTWLSMPDGGIQATCQLPAALPTGTYALRATQGGHTDQREGAVVILDQFPETVDVYIDDTSTLWLQLSDTLSLPVPLPAKGKVPEYEHRYGALPFILNVGDYGLIIFDGQDTREDQLGKLYPLRRALIAKVWTIAISTTPCDNLPFRTQLTLFEDDPIDLLLTPKSMPKAYAQWPRTRFLEYPRKAEPLRFTPHRIELPLE